MREERTSSRYRARESARSKYKKTITYVKSFGCNVSIHHHLMSIDLQFIHTVTFNLFVRLPLSFFLSLSLSQLMSRATCSHERHNVHFFHSTFFLLFFFFFWSSGSITHWIVYEAMYSNETHPLVSFLLATNNNHINKGLHTHGER